MCCFTIERFCCMRLSTASVVIGWVGTKISLIQAIIHIVLLSYKDELAQMIGTQWQQDRVLSHASISLVISIYLAAALLNLVACIMLIIGAKRNSHLMLLPWLINNGIALVIKFILSFVLLAVSVVSNSGLLIIIVIILGIYCWAWTAVYSHFRSIRESKSQDFAFGNRNLFSSKLELLNNSELIPPPRY